jgi:hypothetical protein
MIFRRLQDSKQENEKRQIKKEDRMEKWKCKAEKRKWKDRPTGRQADRPTGRPADRPAGRPADRPTGRPDEAWGRGSALVMMWWEEVQH